MTRRLLASLLWSVAIGALASCATVANHEKILNSWMGRNTDSFPLSGLTGGGVRSLVVSQSSGSDVWFSSAKGITSPVLEITTASGSTNAGVVCDRFASGETAPTGFGAAWNALTSAKELLLSAVCNTDGSVKYTVGSGGQLQYVYKTGYFYTDQWNPFTLTGRFAPGSTDWLLGQGTYTNQNLPATNHFWVAYVCQWTGTQWKCGCQDSACNQSYWQLQGVKAAQTSTDIQPVSHPDGNWVLQDQYSDEFNQSSLDLNKWHKHSGGGKWTWDPDNVWVSDGVLHIRMRYEQHQRNGETFHYKSGMVTVGKDDPIRYGYFEARIKAAPLHPGVSDAFWIYFIEPSLWTEIDIIELTERSNPSVMCTNTHVFRHSALTDALHEQRCNYTAPFDPRDGFHTYGVEWNEKEIKWYIDGKLAASRTNDYWHQPLKIAVSLGVRGPYNKNPSPEGFPTEFQTDYVRVWKPSH